VLAQGSPAQLRQRGRSDGRAEPSMEDSFIAIVDEARAQGLCASGSAA